MTTLSPSDNVKVKPNKLDWTQDVLPTKDDSLSQGLLLAHQRRNSRRFQGKNPQAIKKVRQMLNKNLNFKNMRENNEDPSRAVKLRKMLSVFSNSPRGRAVMSNMRGRQNMTIDEGDRKQNVRAYSSAMRGQRSNIINPEVKSRLNQKLDQFLKNKKDIPNEFRGIPNTDKIPLYNQSNLTKIMSGHTLDRDRTLRFDSRNDEIDSFSNGGSYITKKKSFSNYNGVNVNDRSDASSYMMLGEPIDRYACFSDRESPDSSNNSAVNSKAKNKYLKPLDNTTEFSKFKSALRQADMRDKRKDPMRKNKLNLDLSK